MGFKGYSTSLRVCNGPHPTFEGRFLRAMRRPRPASIKMHDGNSWNIASSKSKLKSNCLRHGSTDGPNDVSASKEHKLDDISGDWLGGR